eukprot:TRINITY_DN600_c0_g1_i5.p1 TRINITY_DN600_c0_g1~~TRINITY_DN600_c0_g1_i5.p1  ORF type:complete len:962 (-),score=236.02 TRINITY_DN600_c0_g1_i5:59-2944(-)
MSLVVVLSCVLFLCVWTPQVSGVLGQGDWAPLRGRLQLFSPEIDELSCLARAVIDSTSFFYVAPCSYEPSQFFVLDQGELRSADQMDSVWTYDVDGSHAVVQGLGGKARSHQFFTLQASSNSTWRWNVSVADFGPMIIYNDQGSTLCVDVSDVGVQQYAFVRVVTDGATDQCTEIKFMLPQDDYIPGTIHYANATTQTSKVPQQCVTYDSAAVPPQSALYLAACDPARTDQRFLYNMVTRHLRWATEKAGTFDGPVLFFWWSGPIKAYPDFDEQTKNYGWKIALSNAASVTAVDRRGYTGHCWSVIEDGTGRRSVTANQTCESFALMPESENFFVKRLQKPPRETSTIVLQVVTGKARGPPKCLLAHREAKVVATADGTRHVDRVWRITVGRCRFERYWLPQRFVLTQNVGSSCSNSTCLGLIRWSGDYEHVLFIATLPDVGPLTGNFPILSSGLEEANIPYEFDFPLDREGPVRTTLPDGTPACFGQVDDDKHVYLTTDMSICLTIRATFASQTGPDYDDPAILTLVRFDYSSAVVQAKALAAISLIGDLGELRKQARTSAKARSKFFRYFDYYFADLGVSGTRRFARSGIGLQITPFGDLTANVHPHHRNGVQFGFLQFSDKLVQNEYTLASVTLRVTRLQPEKTQVLMSFARGSGCVLFVTGLGRLGLKCFDQAQEMFTVQVQDWADDSFSLVGSYHKVSLLFSRHQGGPVGVYVDGVLALSTTNPTSWNILDTSTHLWLFTDPYLWQYHPLPASLTRFSLVASNDLSKLQDVAQRNVLSDKLTFGQLEADPEDIVTASGIQTSWDDCEVVKNDTTGFVEGFSCTLSATQNGQPITVPRDLFNLACSRPRCTIKFDPDAADVDSSFDFTYRSNYPADFQSEDVGSPGLFHDPSFVTDGWTTRSVSFGINYAPVAASLLEVDDSHEVADVMNYRCMQSCCFNLGGGGGGGNGNSQGDVF